MDDVIRCLTWLSFEWAIRWRLERISERWSHKESLDALPLWTRVVSNVSIVSPIVDYVLRESSFVVPIYFCTVEGVSLDEESPDREHWSECIAVVRWSTEISPDVLHRDDRIRIVRVDSHLRDHEWSLRVHFVVPDRDDWHECTNHASPTEAKEKDELTMSSRCTMRLTDVYVTLCRSRQCWAMTPCSSLLNKQHSSDLNEGQSTHECTDDVIRGCCSVVDLGDEATFSLRRNSELSYLRRGSDVEVKMGDEGVDCSGVVVIALSKTCGNGR